MINEIYVASSEHEIASEIQKLKKKKLLKKIAPRIYTTNLIDEPETIIRKNILGILPALYPDAVLSHRSAFELIPLNATDVFVTYSYTKNISLPGVTIHLLAGPKALPVDDKIGELNVSCEARAYLENLQPTRSGDGPSKTISRSGVEDRLQKQMLIRGESGLNGIRDSSRKIANELGMQEEFAVLDSIIGALLSTRPSTALRSETAKAWADKEPYDSDRLNLFGILFNCLENYNFPVYEEKNIDRIARYNFAFYESYFSNYIEGTKFEMSVAKEIIDTKTPVKTREGDSYDILGTFEVVYDRSEMSNVPSSAEEFLDTLKYRHSRVLAYRKDKNPGIFKAANNMAGNSLFVDHRLVVGTLKRGFEIFNRLTDPVARALMIMFITSEVHPFEDGNGRVSRIMMNSELVAAGRSKIIIPNAHRPDYIGGLKRLTQNKEPMTFVRAMEKARKYSSMLDTSDFDSLTHILQITNAFEDDDQYILLMPKESMFKDKK